MLARDGRSIEEDSVRFSVQEKREFARGMRANPTGAEACLWERIKKNKIGYRFQRQITLWGFIVDFYCPIARLAIEVDGSVHGSDDVAANDEVKEVALSQHNIGLLRFTNEEVENSIAIVLRDIKRECDYRMQRETPLKGFGFPHRNPSSSNSRVKGNVENCTETGASRKPVTGETQTPQQWKTPAYLLPSNESLRITQAEQQELNRTIVKLIRQRSMDFCTPDSRPLTERVMDAKYRLSEYLARKQREQTA